MPVLNPKPSIPAGEKSEFYWLGQCSQKAQSKLEQNGLVRMGQNKYRKVNKWYWVRRTLINDKQCVYRFEIDAWHMCQWNILTQRASEWKRVKETKRERESKIDESATKRWKCAAKRREKQVAIKFDPESYVATPQSKYHTIIVNFKRCCQSLESNIKRNKSTFHVLHEWEQEENRHIDASKSSR